MPEYILLAGGTLRNGDAAVLQAVFQYLSDFAFIFRYSHMPALEFLARTVHLQAVQ